MGFLDTFPISDPNPGSWGGWSTSTGDLDLGFGTGGTGAYDANGNLDPNGVDLFAGFFFGGLGGWVFFGVIPKKTQATTTHTMAFTGPGLSARCPHTTPSHTQAWLTFSGDDPTGRHQSQPHWNLR